MWIAGSKQGYLHRIVTKDLIYVDVRVLVKLPWLGHLAMKLQKFFAKCVVPVPTRNTALLIWIVVSMLAAVATRAQQQPAADPKEAPVFHMYGGYVGDGILKAYVLKTHEDPSKLAETARPTMDAERAQDRSIQAAMTVAMYYSGVLQSRGNSEADMIPGTLVQFKELSFRGLYQWLIIGVVALCLIEALLIFALLVQRSRRGRNVEWMRRSEEEFSKAFRSSPDILAVVRRADGVIVEINDQSEGLLGYNRDEIIGSTTQALNVFAKTEDHKEFFRLIEEQGFINDFETDFRSKDGNRLHVTLSANQIMFDNDLCHMITVRDITQRKRAEDALRENEQLFRDVADTAPVLIWMVGTDKAATYVNRAWLEFTGRAVEAELGDGWADGVHPDDLERCLSTFVREFDARRNFRMEYRLRRHDGEYRWLLETGVSRYRSDGTFAGYAGSCIDITERRLAEERLGMLQTITMDVAASEDLTSALKVVLRRVCEKTGWVLGQAWIPRSDGEVLELGPAWICGGAQVEQFAAESKEIQFRPGVGLPGRAWSSKQHVWIKDVTLDANSPRAGLAMKAGLKAGLAIPIVSCDKVTTVIEFFLRDTQNEDERLVRVIVAVAAQLNLVIERKEAEDNLQHLTGQLIHLQDEERRRIAAELHDGLGQSLAIIRNRAAICLRDPANHDRVSEQLEEISSTAVSAIDEVREIAHNLRPYELDRLGLVQAIESMVDKIADTTSIRVAVNLDPIDGLLSPDAETSIYRIVQEGLNNVVKHSNATAASVSLSRPDNDHIIVAVKDNGRGIERARNANGRGFGLTGIAERVRMLGATLKIESEPGCGTMLSVRLCRAKETSGR